MDRGHSGKEVHAVPSGIAATNAALGREYGFTGFIRFYVRIFVWILAILGFCVVAGLQFKWVGIDWLPGGYPAVDALTLEIKGPANLFSQETFVIDTGKTYQLGADVRVLPKSDGSPQDSVIYFGVQTFDANGKVLGSGPGTYRYAGANKKVVGSQQNWIHIGGLITGEGDSNHNQFRPGTHSVKLVLRPNYGSGDDKIFRIRNVSFSERITFAP